MNWPGMWEITPHVLSIILVTLLIIVFFVFIVGNKIKNQSPSKAPGYFQSILENIIIGFNNYFDGLTRGRMKRLYPYFLTLYFFILFNAITDLFGIIPGASALGFTLTIGFITFIGIYVAGIIGYGVFGFIKKKYKSPLELFTQFSPFISISLRLFGSTFAMVVLAKAIPEIFANFFPTMIMDYIFPWFSIIYLWGLSGFASAMSAIQALVFVTLTIVYWGNELGDPAERKKIKVLEKEAKKDLRIQKTREIRKLDIKKQKGGK